MRKLANPLIRPALLNGLWLGLGFIGLFLLLIYYQRFIGGYRVLFFPLHLLGVSYGLWQMQSIEQRPLRWGEGFGWVMFMSAVAALVSATFRMFFLGLSTDTLNQLRQQAYQYLSTRGETAESIQKVLSGMQPQGYFLLEITSTLFTALFIALPLVAAIRLTSLPKK
ncbi:DUF4199 family protein [Eisenibacter elegans]|uniref:DUF4199 family protein n=1 Tax=Eisenibacter elegans TaxID=997 RepID=UPI00040B1003|nr:DUF4199 family protein [Eisenibacter elegans]